MITFTDREQSIIFETVRRKRRDIVKHKSHGVTKEYLDLTESVLEKIKSEKKRNKANVLAKKTLKRIEACKNLFIFFSGKPLSGRTSVVYSNLNDTVIIKEQVCHAQLTLTVINDKWVSEFGMPGVAPYRVTRGNLALGGVVTIDC